MASKKQKRQPTGDYEVGYCRPPAQHRFRPGQSGNPTGERKDGWGKTIADELKEILATKVTIRDGARTRKVCLVTANLLAHGMSGAKGDARSAALFLSQAQKMGLLDTQESDQIRIGPEYNSRPSDLLLAGTYCPATSGLSCRSSRRSSIAMAASGRSARASLSASRSSSLRGRPATAPNTDVFFLSFQSSKHHHGKSYSEMVRAQRLGAAAPVN
jgi:hypothetical protein